MTRPKIVKKRVHVKGHYIHRGGKRIWIKPFTYYRKVLRYKGDFDKIAQKIAKRYMKKGYSRKRAIEIGKKTAGDIYRMKLAKSYRRTR